MSIGRQSALNKLGWCEMVSSATGCGGVTVDTKTIEECKTLIEELIGENERLGIENFDLICELSRIKENTARAFQNKLREVAFVDATFMGKPNVVLMDDVERIIEKIIEGT